MNKVLWDALMKLLMKRQVITVQEYEQLTSVDGWMPMEDAELIIASIVEGMN